MKKETAKVNPAAPEGSVPDSTAPNGVKAGEAVSASFEGLTLRQAQAVEALTREPTFTRAAGSAGVHERTLRKWMGDPVFKSAVLTARRESFGQAVGLSQRYAPVAVATLVKVMQDSTITSSARVTAAALLLRFGRDGIELDDLVARLEALERTAWGGNGPIADAAGRQGDTSADDDEQETE